MQRYANPSIYTDRCDKRGCVGTVYHTTIKNIMDTKNVESSGVYARAFINFGIPKIFITLFMLYTSDVSANSVFTLSLPFIRK